MLNHAVTLLNNALTAAGQTMGDLVFLGIALAFIASPFVIIALLIRLNRQLSR